MSSPSTKSLPIGTFVVGVLFLLTMLATYLLVKPKPPPAELQGVISTQFRTLEKFELISQKTRPLTQANLKARWSFIFFGYTSCPDVCPTTLHVLSQVYRLLMEEDQSSTAQVQVIFVSVDPQRDSLQKTTEYTGFFDKDFLAVTGDEASLRAFSKQFNAGFIIEPETAPGIYNVAHTSAIFLVDPLGRRVATFSQPHYAATIFRQFSLIREYFSS